MNWFFPCLSLSLTVAAFPVSAQGSYTHFEARHTHPAGLSPDGTRLFVLNSPDARLSVFDISNTANPAPVLLAEIPVGIEPVSLRARTNDEVWVVNELSDSISIVSISRQTTLETLQAPDEPADVVFAQGKAFVSCARNNMVRVFDGTSRALLGTISLNGLYPRALATDVAGTRVFAAFQLSGNGTTVLPHTQAPAPPPPANVSLPGAPQTALIVPANDPRIPYTVTDHDVAEIDVATHSVTGYVSSIGTNIFDLAVSHATGQLWITSTDARNLIRFEPALRGHFVDNRLSRVDLPAGTATAFDLNPGVDYNTLPNPAAQVAALAQPAALVVAADSTHAWVAAFGSDRVAKVLADGTIAARIDLRPAPGSSRQMRGPRGLAWNEGGRRLYVMNKLANTVSVIDTVTSTLLAEVSAGSHDPMPTEVKEGRGFLFDARLSGNGTASCASCHLDADRDGLAWDLGDPDGEMMIVKGANLSVHDSTPRDRVMHPMKGPMTTQTLRGIQNGAPFHWRGDRATLQNFNGTFERLMGGTQLDDDDIDAMAAYIVSLRHHPNPNRNTDRSLPLLVSGGNPTRGRTIYNNHIQSHCAICHVLPSGSDNNIDLMTEVGSTQPVKTVSLATVYQRTFFNPQAGQTALSGFGLLHDGTGFALPTAHPYQLSQMETPQEFADVAAFVMCFDTGTAPAIGFSRTVTAENRMENSTIVDVETLEGQAAQLFCDLVVRGVFRGQLRAFYFDNQFFVYRRDRTGTPEYSKLDLFELLQSGDAITFMGVPPGDGPRLGGDRDADGTLDADEALPPLTVEWRSGSARLQWPQHSGDWFPEVSDRLEPPWVPLNEPRTTASGSFFLQLTVPPPTAGFFRLRRTW